MSVFSEGREPSKEVLNDGQMLECYHCWYKTKNKLSLEDHMRLSHLVEKPFKCDKCDFRAIGKNHLQQHMKVHVMNVFGCSICNFKSYDRSIVKRHLNVHNKDSSRHYKRCGYTTTDWVNKAELDKPHLTATDCKHCNYKAVSRSDFKGHMASHNVDREYACDLCDYKSSVRYKMRLHELSHIGKTPFMCYHCDFKSATKSRMRHHMTYHTGEKPFACSHCDYRTNERSSLRTHLRVHTGEKPFACSYCDYTTSDRDCFTAHVTTHTGEKLFPCDICGFRTNCRGNLRKHKQQRHSEQKLCGACGFAAPNERAFRDHIRVHSMEKPFSCDQCAYTSYNRANFVSHQKTHCEKKLTCTYCPYSARKSRDMKRHLDNVHSTEKKRFKCKECNYRTADKKAFNNHKRVHTGQKPYGCTVCDKTYNRRPALYDHTVKVHARKEGEGRYICKLCDFKDKMYSTKTNKEMAEHVLSSHTPKDAPPATLETVQPKVDKNAPVVHVPFACSVCHKVYNERLNLQDHVVSVHARKEGSGFTCNMCDYSFPIYSTKTAEDMSEHILSSHAALHVPSSTVEAPVQIDPAAPVLLDIVDYVCNICKHKANNVSDMAKHMLTAHSTSDATATMLVPVGAPMLPTFLASDAPGIQFDA